MEASHPPNSLRWTAWVAWIVIVVACLAGMTSNGAFDIFFPRTQAEAEGKPQPLELEPGLQIGMMIRMGDLQTDPNWQQSQMTQLFGTTKNVEQFAKIGPPGTEVFGAIALAQWGNQAGAVTMIDELTQRIDAGKITATPEQMQIVSDVRAGVVAAEDPKADALPVEVSERLIAELGGPGKTLVAVATNDQGLRQELQVAAMPMLVAMLIAGFGACTLGLVGVVTLIVFCVFAVTGRVRGAGPPSGEWSNVLAEMFAVWIGVFVAGKLIVEWLVTIAPDLLGSHETFALVFSLVDFAAATSLAVVWARMRGMSWQQLWSAVGVTRPSISDVGWGLLGYTMAYPLLAAGVVVYVILNSLLIGLGVDPNDIRPSHPVQGLLQSDSILTIALTFVLASIAAPLVEEFVFRGILYRQLRDGLGVLGKAISIACATLFSSVLFAAIHPQGIVFIPILSALAIAFCLIREWRGSILPGMWAHGIHNAIVLTLGLVIAR